jgi:hypothetical protein
MHAVRDVIKQKRRGKKRMFSAEEAAEHCTDSDSEREWFDGDDDEGPH